MSSSMNKLAEKLSQAMSESEARKPKPYDAKAIVKRIDNNTAWVELPGGESETPVQKTSNARVGDEVIVRLSGGRAWLLGNNTSPATDDTKANRAIDNAAMAQVSANSALASANVAHDAAISAMQEADVAHQAANSAAEDAATAQEAANTALEQADIAIESANTALEQAESAIESAGRAETAATEAEAKAEAAETSASEAKTFAENAETSAGEAKDSAHDAYLNSNKALYHLEEIENVLDVLGWLSEHATYDRTEDDAIIEGKWYFQLENATFTTGTPTSNPKAEGFYEEISQGIYDRTSDTELVSGKTYYIRTSGDFVVGSPESNPHDEGFYEATVKEAVTNYISTHLYLDNDGLYVRMDKDNGAKIKITGTGIDLIDEYGFVIASYTNYVRLGNEKGVHITLSPTNGLGFYQGAEDDNDPSVNRVAYINENKLYITQAELTDSLRIGNFIWKIRTKYTLGDRISFRYEPIRQQGE